jgi:uncharacterized protein (TIGR03118 family)
MSKHQLALCVLAGLAASGTGAFAQKYTVSKIVSNGSTPAAWTDANLVNPWGLSRATGSPWWVADNGTGKSTLYDGGGDPQGLIVTIPAAQSGQVGTPTGTIFNGTPSFAVTPGNPALFLFSTEDGTISGWNPGVNFTSAVVKVTTANGVYKGLTSAAWNGKRYLYAPNFHSGQIDVFDGNFQPVQFGAGAFRDPQALGLGLVPFNVQNIGGTLYVAFAKQDGAKHDNVNGPGLGLVAAFNPVGKLIMDFEYGQFLNAPWGLVMAPGDFGYFSHALLVGNFGSGQILAFNAQTGNFIGSLKDATGKTFAYPGLWGLSFGASAPGDGNFNSLYFATGGANEGSGILGTLTPVPGDLTQGNDL